MSSRGINLSAVPKQEPRLSAEEYRSIAGKPRRNKFGARKTVVGGITFDSKREAEYYAELKLREKAGEVHEIELQPEFRLIVNGNDCGRFRAGVRTLARSARDRRQRNGRLNKQNSCFNSC